MATRHHPASQPWSAEQTASYRRVWEELESDGDLHWVDTSPGPHPKR